MKQIVINNTMLLFLEISDFTKFSNNELYKLKKEYLTEYDNCIIYNYFDLKYNKKLIRDKINKLKFINQTKVDARKCVIRQIESAQKNSFLNEYHIQGTDKSQFAYGAFYGDELISVMSFDSRKSFNGGLLDGEYDLSRFAVKTGYIITGIFNKILRYFINDYIPKKIISFADLNTSSLENNIYKSNGFILKKMVQPDFKYYSIKDDKLYHKFTYGTRYNKNDKILEEVKNKTKNQLIKVWNCGKVKYELHIDNNNRVISGFIYMFKNKINNKIYIGQTTRSAELRYYEHKTCFNKQTHCNDYLQKAFNKYGWDNFEFSVIDNATSLKELNEKEISYIKEYKSNDKNFGYNIELGGNNAIPSSETLLKMSNAHKGIKQSKEWVERKIAKAGTEDAKKYGRPKTEEDKIRLSINSPKYWEGKSRDEETKLKISKTKKEKGFSDKQKEANNKKVYKINSKTNEILNTFESTGQASIDEKVNQSTISRWCVKNRNIDNILWSYNYTENNK